MTVSSSGLKLVCPGSLRQRNRLLVLSGLRGRKKLWVLAEIEKNERATLQASSDIRVHPRELFWLGISILKACLLTSMAPAIFYCRKRWYRTYRYSQDLDHEI